MTRGASQSVPTPITNELARVVTSVADGAPLGAFAATAAAPTRDDAAPVNAITVSDAATELFNLAVTFMPERATGVNAHQISAVPSCAFDRTALVHVMAPLLFVTLLTSVFGAQHGSGASVDTNATSNVFAAAAINGLATVVA